MIAQHFRSKKTKINKLVNDRHDEILKLSKTINYDYLTFDYKNKNMREKVFNNFDNTFWFFKKIKNGEITLEKANTKKIIMNLNQI